MQKIEFADGSEEYIKVYRNLQTTTKKELHRQFCANFGSCMLITTSGNASMGIIPIGTMTCGSPRWSVIPITERLNA